MEPSQKDLEGEPTVREVTVWLLRLFAIVALLFGWLHLADGLSVLIKTLRRHSVIVFQLQLATIFVDLVFGLTSLVVAVGLFFLKEWARRAWLAFLILMLVVWLHLTIMKFLAGYRMYGIYPWILMLILVSAISWGYLTRARIKARFR